MTIYSSDIKWLKGSEIMHNNAGVKYAPVIKSDVFGGADELGWNINILNMTAAGHDDISYADFHFISPDVPSLMKKGDVFTLWNGSRLIAEGIVTKCNDERISFDYI